MSGYCQITLQQIKAFMRHISKNNSFAKLIFVCKRVKMASTVDFTPLQNEEETNTLEDTTSNSNAQRGKKNTIFGLFLIIRQYYI